MLLLGVLFGAVIGRSTAPAKPAGDVDGRPTTSTTVPAPHGGSNPVLDTDFPDPSMSRDGDTYVAFATNAAGVNVQVSKTKDLRTWSAPAEAMPVLPTWSSTPPDIWAPHHVRIGERDVLFYSARNATTGRMCVGVARSDSTYGPYVQLSGRPLVCDTELGGAIDPSVVVADGRTWLLWKTDGNCCGIPVSIRVGELDPDSLTLLGPPVELLGADLEWEGGIVEAPEMVELEGRLLLFYSGGNYVGPGYAVGYAECAAVIGPCVKPRIHPLLGSTGAVVGPGGQSVFADDRSEWWIAYHAWEADRVGYDAGGERTLRIDQVKIVEGRPVVLGPT